MELFQFWWITKRMLLNCIILTSPLMAHSKSNKKSSKSNSRASSSSSSTSKSPKSIETPQQQDRNKIFWFRISTLALAGALAGVIPLIGVFGFLVGGLALLTSLWYSKSLEKKYLDDDPSQLGFASEAMAPGLMSFLLLWIVLYNIIHVSDSL